MYAPTISAGSYTDKGEDYSKLPSSPTVDLVYLLDPMVATGGTAVAAINMLTDWGLSGLYISLCP
jgi:uracil phosphoribosyltransferase